jgi:hypothetical protein
VVPTDGCGVLGDLDALHDPAESRDHSRHFRFEIEDLKGIIIEILGMAVRSRTYPSPSWDRCSAVRREFGLYIQIAVPRGKILVWEEEIMGPVKQHLGISIARISLAPGGHGPCVRIQPERMKNRHC